jgi:hypothetical protein
VTLSLSVPDGWSATATAAGRWRVTARGDGLAAYSFLTVTAAYRQRGRPATVSDTRGIRALPSPPTQDSYVSDLPFLIATNGWGPVERDQSNGENAAGDGHPMTIGGVVYAKGLGVHPSGDAGFYLAGRCTTFSAVVGVDDEVGDSGSVRFHVLVDGAEVWSSAVLTGAGAGVPVSVPVSGGQQVDLVVDDGGDGNGLDHADWADARVTCS